MRCLFAFVEVETRYFNATEKAFWMWKELLFKESPDDASSTIRQWQGR
jgi:hypothetical protein